MINLINSMDYARKYTKIIYPVASRRASEYKKYTGRIKKPAIRAYALEALEKNRFDTAVSSVCSLYPNVDMALAADVMFSFQAVVQYLNTYCSGNFSNSGPFVRAMFSSLKDALNIRSDSYENYFTFFPSKDDSGYLSILVEKCRQKVRLLPSFDIIRDHLTAFLALFIDLQIIKYSSDDDGKEIDLFSWSSIHGQKYPELSNWEFCMAIDSTLSIQLLLALATNPDLEEQKAESLNNAFFPWICGIQKILEGYINYNDNLLNGGVNYDFYYENLKEYENKVAFFINKAEEIHHPNSKYLRLIVKILLSVYITHPKADEGMNKITGKALKKAGGRGMNLYVCVLKLLRAGNRL